MKKTATNGSAQLILIIDDDTSVLESLGVFLEDAGYSIILRPDGESGLKFIETHDVACVLTDLRMPGLSGIDVISAVAKMNPFIPVIVISGTDDIQGVTESFRLGAWDYILKPINDMSLLEYRIKSILEKSALAEENRRYQKTLEQQVKERTAQLDSTVADLQDAESRLKHINSELENKVTERTRYLHKAISEIARNDRILALNRLVSGISHEVNTPVGVSISGITFIKENLNKYRDTGNLTGEQVELIKNCVQASDLIYDNLVKTDILMKQFQEISTERKRTEAQFVDMHRLLNTIVQDFEQDLKRTDIALHIDCPDTILFRSYPMSIIQIIKGLLKNSMDHAYPKENKGQIGITVQLNNKHCVIEYSDDGIGIDEEVRRRMFDPFFTTSDESEHTGLGLSIVFNTITDGLDGTIECSNNSGKGVDFTISFPTND